MQSLINVFNQYTNLFGGLGPEVFSAPEVIEPEVFSAPEVIEPEVFSAPEVIAPVVFSAPVEATKAPVVDEAANIAAFRKVFF